jgi:hypothetical protein
VPWILGLQAGMSYEALAVATRTLANLRASHADHDTGATRSVPERTLNLLNFTNTPVYLLLGHPATAPSGRLSPMKSNW